MNLPLIKYNQKLFNRWMEEAGRKESAFIFTIAVNIRNNDITMLWDETRTTEDLVKMLDHLSGELKKQKKTSSGIILPNDI